MCLDYQIRRVTGINGEMMMAVRLYRGISRSNGIQTTCKTTYIIYTCIRHTMCYYNTPDLKCKRRSSTPLTYIRYVKRVETRNRSGLSKPSTFFHRRYNIIEKSHFLIILNTFLTLYNGENSVHFHVKFKTLIELHFTKKNCFLSTWFLSF